MEKKQTRAFGKNIFLLGKDAKGVNYWLEAASWNCGWYWGFGYVETYTNNAHPEYARDIESHQHFNGLFLEKDIFDSFKNLLVETPLTNDEIWALLGYMREFYTLREYADILHSGNHITGKAKNLTLEKNKEDNQREYDRINKIILPELFTKIYELLGGGSNE